jgi:tetratricopeptide (TPR) repeat protein
MQMNESIKKWLNELDVEPTLAINRLVLGQAAVPAWSRASLREIFVEVYQTHSEVLDGAVTEWLRGRLLQMPPEQTPTLVWATRLQDVFRAIAGLPLPKVAHLLRNRLRDFRIWLRPLATDKSLDPEAAYFAALSWAETNQHLEGMWQSFALRLNKEKMHYIDIGLLGLRKSRDDSGQLPHKAPLVLLTTLIDLADVYGMTKKTWLLTTRAIMGGYHCSLDTWVREFEPVLAVRKNAQNGPEWLQEILPKSDGHKPTFINTAAVSSLPTLHECKMMISEVSRHGTGVAGLEQFLNRHRAYANTTRDSHFIVRTFNSLAEAARLHDPNWAIVRAEEALCWDKNDAHNWTVLARCLWSRGFTSSKKGDVNGTERDCREAIDILWEARNRFPWNAHLRTDLGRLYRDAGDLLSAEAVLTEAIVEFPMSPACACELADVYAKSNRIGEAEKLYREIAPIFPDNPYWRNGLSTILFYRSAENSDETEKEKARALFKEAADLGDGYARKVLKVFDMVWRQAYERKSNFETQGRDESVELESIAIVEMRPAQRLGRSLLLQWQARCADSLEERECFFKGAEDLLNLPDELTGECRTAFVEARGFLRLAQGHTAEARDYFEQHIAAFSRPPLALRLGLTEARARLGEPISSEDEEELAKLGPDGSILPLVFKVIHLLESTTSDSEIKELLVQIYPSVMKLGGLSLDNGEEPSKQVKSDKVESADKMMAQLLIQNVFRPAGITSIADIQCADNYHGLFAQLSAKRDQLFSVIEEYAMAANG